MKTSKRIVGAAAVMAAGLVTVASAVIPINNFTKVTLTSNMNYVSCATSYQCYFGSYFGDCNGDGRTDIIAGNNIFFNPGSDISKTWTMKALPDGLDGGLAYDWDKDGVVEIIAEKLPDVYVLKSADKGSTWTKYKIGVVNKEPNHNNGQGWALANLTKSAGPDIVLTGQRIVNRDEISMFKCPTNVTSIPYETFLISKTNGEGTHEDVGVGDIDRDGYDDVAGQSGEGVSAGGVGVSWWWNPHNGTGGWTARQIGSTTRYNDRCKVADINGDGWKDIVVTEAKWDDYTQVQSTYWFENPTNPLTNNTWIRHTISDLQHSTHGLNVGDFDLDGDIDVVTSTTRDPYNVVIWENLDGKGLSWKKNIIGSADIHNTLVAFDYDNDGDLDISGFGFFNMRTMILFRNNGNPVTAVNPNVNTASTVKNMVVSIANNNMHIMLPGTGRYTLTLMSTNGRIVEHRKDIVSGSDITTAGKNGVYLLTATDGERVFTRKVICTR